MLLKAIRFLKRPHLPHSLDSRLQHFSPPLRRLLKYGTLDPTSKKYWDAVWHDEGQSTWRTYPNLFEIISRTILPGSHVLDIGCGPGILLNRLRAAQSCKCIGLDLSSVAMSLLNQAGIPSVVAQLPDIPFRSATFDAVVATEVLEHLEDPAGTLQQMKRVTRAGGLIICSVPNECLTTEECDEHLHNFDLESFAALLGGLGNVRISTVRDKGGDKLVAVIRTEDRHTDES